jgi:Flp pilus assembly protein TadD
MPMDRAQVTAQFERELKAADRSRNPEDRALFLLRWHQPLMALDEVQDVDGSVAKASALLALDRQTAAGKAAHRAVEVHPKDAVAWLDLARVEMANGNIAEAVNASAQSMKLKQTPDARELHDKAARRLSTE